ncbi:MAG: spore coat protein CotJB [Oscillospiraceae bacterium]|nr:spore coat protein CotJB [Oscillospiraceae bacterium]
MNGERNSVLNRVHQAGFALDEAVLYLDTHPFDQAALSYYRQARDEQKKAMAEHQAKVGPLSSDLVDCADSWGWVREPWPWEREANY